jgi:hypothetical protein
VDSKHNPVSGQITWASLSFRDLQMLCDSILLASYNVHFCRYLGREKVGMEAFSQSLNNNIHVNSVLQQCKAGKYNTQGEFVPTYPDGYKILVHLEEMPACISNPKHWGFLVWQYCAFMDQFGHDTVVPTVWTTTE